MAESAESHSFVVRVSVFRDKKKDFRREYRLALGSLAEIDYSPLLWDWL
jgi:hypothetical protein